MANQSVATSREHTDLGCGDNVYVVGVGKRKVRDVGGGVSSTQLDHYIGRTPCNAAETLDPAKTIKLF